MINSASTPSLGHLPAQAAPDPLLVAPQLRTGTRVASWVAIFFGAVGLVSWTAEVTTWMKPTLLMVPNTAVCFIFAGASLWTLRIKRLNKVAWPLARGAALLVAVVGSITALEYLFDWDAGIDGWLFGESMRNLQPVLPGRPAILSSVNFALLGGGLLLLNVRTANGNKPTEFLALTAILISLLGLIGYVCSVPLFYGWRSLFPNAGMALTTVVAFLVLGVGMFSARPEGGLMEIIVSRSTSGLLVRRLLLAPVFVPLLTGWFRLVAERHGLYNAEFAAWFYAFGNIFVLSLIVWKCAQLVHRVDGVRFLAEVELQELNANLEERIQERTLELEGAMGALRTSEELVSLVVDTAMDAVITADDKGRIRSWNREAERIFGWPAAEVIGLKMVDTIVPVQFREGHERGFQHFLATGEGPVLHKRIEISALHRDGREFPVELAITPIRQGRSFVFSAFVRDITERNRAAEKLRESEERFRTMADQAPVLIWMSGTDKLCNWFNLVWLDFVGRPMEKELGNGWAEGVHPDDLAQCLQTYVESFEARRSFVMEYRLRRHDGVYRWLSDHGVPRSGPGGEFAGYIGSCIDVTDRREALQEVRALNADLEQRVAQRTAQLEAANRELESFSYSVSHDLRAPIRHVAGYVDMLREELQPVLAPETRRQLDIITGSALQMGNLIDDLLDFSRMGRAEMSQTSFNCAELIPEVLRQLEPETRGRTIDWEIDPLPELAGDRAMMKQVWLNLLSNAIKYTRNRVRAEIKIGCVSRDHEFEFYVSDNGAGFDMKYAGKLFGVFQRLHLADEFEGTGIGLASVRRIVARHGGVIWAEGQVNAGATFHFTLPRSPILNSSQHA